MILFIIGFFITFDIFVHFISWKKDEPVREQVIVINNPVSSTKRNGAHIPFPTGFV